MGPDAKREVNAINLGSIHRSERVERYAHNLLDVESWH
jgi:hypothetical protein